MARVVLVIFTEALVEMFWALDKSPPLGGWHPNTANAINGNNARLHRKNGPLLKPNSKQGLYLIILVQNYGMSDGQILPWDGKVFPI